MLLLQVTLRPVNTLPETFADPQVQHNQMAVEVEHARVGKIKVGGHGEGKGFWREGDFYFKTKVLLKV